MKITSTAFKLTANGCIFMVKGVPGTRAIVNGPFFMDRFEVSNREYKEFVDLGGYGDPRYWKEEFRKDGKVIPWEEAVKTFVDRTGRPGPAAWEGDGYPKGRDDYPGSGMSWYEAAAYARFRNKTLPTLYHWARAAFTRDDYTTPLTPSLITQSNIEKTADLRFFDPYTILPRSEESLETFKKMFSYEKGPLHPVVESRKPGGKEWVWEKVTITAAYPGFRTFR